MFKTKSSLGKKITAYFAGCILVLSIIFSFVSYELSMWIVNQYVLPQFENTLQTNIRELERNLDKTLATRSDAGSDSAYASLLAFLNEQKQDMGAEYVYVLGKKDKAYIVALSGAAEKRNADYTFTAGMERAFDNPGTVQFSEVYEDSYGVHKSVFTRLAGTDMIIGIDMNAEFVKKLNRYIIGISIFLTLALIVFGFAAGYSIARKIIKPIQLLVQHTQKVAAGDLRDEIKIANNDELGQLATSFNHMSQQLKDMISQLSATSNHVVDSSETLSANAQLTTEMAHQMVAATEEIVSGNQTVSQAAEENAQAMGEIASGIQHISESAVAVAEQSVKAAQEANDGNDRIQKAVLQMDSISASLSHSTVLVKQTNERTNQIGHVVELITSIADQINLLALNAAIEAARAGEYGRGFAVVADEVRKLAEQSAASASKIAGSLHAICEDSIKSVEAMNQMAAEVQAGTEVVNEAGQAFENILSLIDDISQKIQAVSAVTQQVSASAQQVSASAEETVQIASESLENTRKIAASSQEQLASMEESANAIKELQARAHSLQSKLGNFKI
ncbi:methyl-accepting chemotaxis protein [Aneurinibacillus thermoaerophilus]|uniref:methyl-accepting chemotaxis protein n=1 Tax=Aneurinibacillus thermoaerophilus TaxID=143495 RepID=UPI002E1DF4AA|nr:methyl-accepting chemotaxis protein [Aneurinibacillus thermoaerophilus]